MFDENKRYEHGVFVLSVFTLKNINKNNSRNVVINWSHDPLATELLDKYLGTYTLFILYFI